jgi:hypothetical protein
LINETSRSIPTGKNVRVMFQDEGRFGRVSLPRRCWAPYGVRPLRGAQIIREYIKAAWHTAGKLKVPDNMKLFFLPPYSPQLNPVEHLWKEVREKYFANLVFDSIDAVEKRLMEALIFMNQNSDTVKSFSGFDWIVTSL